jgi:iron complex transport system substrate-binding protein
MRRRGTSLAVSTLVLASCGGAATNAFPADTSTAPSVAAAAATLPDEAAPAATPRTAPTSTAAPTTAPATAPSTSPVADPAAAPALPVALVDATGTEVTVRSIDRIIPVDGDLAEIVFALGLGDRVVATDLSATYPPEVDRVPDIGYQRALSPEPIAAFEPTVVLATDLAQPVETLEQLRDLGIPVVVINREFTLDGPARKVMAVAEALGVPDRGLVLANAMEAELDVALERAAAVADRPRTLVLYLRGEQTQLIFGAGTGVDVFLPAVGATDVAAELGVEGTRQLTAEAVLEAAPEVLIVTTTGLASVGGLEGFLAIPGIARTPAGETGRVLVYEDQFLLGLGPRFGRLVARLTADLHPDVGGVELTPASTDPIPTTDP